MRRLVLVALSLAAPSYYWLGSFHTPLMGLPPGPLLVGAVLYSAVLLLLTAPPDSAWRIHRSVASPAAVAALATGFAMVAMVIQGADLATAFRSVARGSGAGLGIALCAYLFATTRRRFTVLLGGVLFAITVSAGVAVGQFLVGEPFFRLWMASGELPASERVVSSVLDGQVAGLARFSVPLGYQLASALPIVLALGITGGAVGFPTRLLLWAVFLVLFAALIFSGIRTAIAGVAVAFLLILLLDRKQQFPYRRMTGILLTVAAAFLVVSAVPHPNLGRLVRVDDLSARTKVPLALSGVYVALESPLFGARLKYSEVAGDASVRMDLNDDVDDVVAQHTSHNHLINVAAFYGIPALVLVLLFYLLLVRTLLRIWTGDDRYRMALRTGLLGSLTAHTVTSLAHNGGPFVGDVVVWFSIGLMFALVRRWPRPAEQARHPEPRAAMWKGPVGATAPRLGSRGHPHTRVW